MNDTTMIDVTAEEIGSELVPANREPVALFRTDDPGEVVEKATQVANALASVIQAKRLFAHIQGKNHVLVEGWQLLGSMLGVTAVCVATEPVDGGFKATVEARTADGRVIGRADALCTKHEKRGPWKTADDYARLSMAQTRATSKALKGPLGFVVSLAGYETTPAEEMTFAQPDVPDGPSNGSAAPIVTASPAEATEKLLTAAQRRKINAEAGKHQLSPLFLLNAIRMASGVEPKDASEITDEQAVQATNRLLDRLPARLMADVLAAIGVAAKAAK